MLLCRRHGPETDVVAYGWVESRALVGDGEPQARAVDVDRDVDALGAVRDRRMRRVVEHVANRLLDRRFDDDWQPGLCGWTCHAEVDLGVGFRPVRQQLVEEFP